MTTGLQKRTLMLLSSLAGLALMAGCSKNNDPAAEAPPPPNVVLAAEPSLFTVDRPEQFPLATATERPAFSELTVTGTVAPDIARNVPVVSLATGRVVAIHARLGDTVNKGQLLLTVRSDDVSSAFSDYRKAVADEVLSRAQFERSKDLYEHGAIALNDLQVSQDAEDKAKVDVETTSEHLRLLGDLVANLSALATARLCEFHGPLLWRSRGRDLWDNHIGLGLPSQGRTSEPQGGRGSAIGSMVSLSGNAR